MHAPRRTLGREHIVAKLRQDTVRRRVLGEVLAAGGDLRDDLGARHVDEDAAGRDEEEDVAVALEVAVAVVPGEVWDEGPVGWFSYMCSWERGVCGGVRQPGLPVGLREHLDEG